MIRIERPRLRDNQLLRSIVMPILAVGCRPDLTSNWIVFPMYHDFEQAGQKQFAAQLRFMRSLGDVLGLDDAVELLAAGKLDGRYFCLTVDDGAFGAYRYAYPVLAEQQFPAAFFIVPSWIEREDSDTDMSRRFMTWRECRELSTNGATIGSHSQTHARFAELGMAEASAQMTQARDRIQTELGMDCNHFACPWGQPDRDYLPVRDVSLAMAAGYRSFLTTINRRASKTTNPFAIPRIRVEPAWSLRQLQYVFFR